jgi:hypothetical protein
MEYLLHHLMFYVGCAFLLGLFVGWATCTRRGE